MDTFSDDKHLIITRHCKSILNLIPDAVYISSRDGKTLFVNHRWEDLSGFPAEKVLDENVEDLVKKGVFKQIINPTVVSTGEVAMTVQELNGRNVVINGNPVFGENNEVEMVVTFVRDITAFNHLKKEIATQKDLISSYQKQVASFDPEVAFQDDGMVAVGKHSLSLLKKIETIAPSDAAVLILGETGVGKDVVAQRIHRHSQRKNKEYLKVDCSAIAETLIESELFGYAPGAFSGASIKGKKGYFEQASGGTLFLDEIGELPLPMQTRLLRAIQDQEIIRVGSTQPIPIDVRIIAATNRDLQDAVNEGAFRSDLYYRLKVAVLNIRSLKERKDDILPLIKVFLKQKNTRYGKNVFFSNCAEQKLINYEWPGNVRELKNTIHSIVIMANKSLIKAVDLPKEFAASFACDDSGNPAMNSSELGKKSLKSMLQDIEKNIINDAISVYGSIGKAAEVLQINRSTIFRKTRDQKS
ncbi:sigma-54 interaction domain-containing protein [Desulfospira joergensenii]|uniref:sigma-54 interaction domain-containing protein n=1 Tax=Desulfospira joergensenii TaxID=53329 RepID=UPI0003B74591|nr:sigma 54-interacting transcriptional regulator [Desulfospira joergensenii]